MAMHAGELPIDAAVARDLIDAQFPQWRGLHVRRVTSSGTANAIFRVGDRLAARFPLQGADPAATRRELESEAAAARELAAATRFPVPALVALGEPGSGYPLPWSVQTWLPGRTGDQDDPSGQVTFASDLAEFIVAVRAIGTRGRTFTGRGRGGDLKNHDDWMHTCLRESEGLLDVRRLTRMWAAFRELPREAPDVMSHRDLTPGNVLISSGHLAGVLDVGSYGAADPALDLISAWNLFEAGPRQVLRTALRCTDLDWERSKAWAFQQAMGLVWYYADSNPVMSRLGRTTLDRIMAAAEVLPEPERCVKIVTGISSGEGSGSVTEDSGRATLLQQARSYLRDADPVLARLIQNRPDFDPQAWMTQLPAMDLFGALLFQVIGQQLSVAATRRILARIEALFGGHLPSPTELLGVDPAKIREAGLSWRKITTLRDLAERLSDGRLDQDALSILPDDELIAELTAIPGIGPWTVQGALLVALRREDVVLPGDLALRKAIQAAYQLDHIPSQDEVLAIAEKWRPYRSLATSYLFSTAYEPAEAPPAG